MTTANRSLARALRVLTAREPMTDQDVSRALTLASHLDPTSAAYEVALSAMTGVRCDPTVWRGGRVNGDGWGSATDTTDRAVSVAPGVMVTLCDDAEPARQGRGVWHGTVPTGQPVQAATVHPAMATAWAMATDDRVSMPVQRWQLVQAIGFGLVQAQTGRIQLSRVADALGATGSKSTRERAAKDALADVRQWVGAMVGRAVREACTVQPAQPRILASGIVSGRIPAPCTPDLPCISTGAPTLTRAQRSERAARRRAARQARQCYAETLAISLAVVTVTHGQPRQVTPHTWVRPTLTPGERYRTRLLADPVRAMPAMPTGAVARHIVQAQSVCGVCHTIGIHDDTCGHEHGASGAVELQTLTARRAARATRTARAAHTADVPVAAPTTARQAMSMLLAG